MGFLNSYFEIDGKGSSLRTEILAGIATFLTMAYIVVVNPAILSDAGMDFGSVFVAVGAGASAVIVAIYTLVGCDMMQATNGGAPIGFPIGGSVQNLGGLQCIDTDRNGVNNTIVAWLATAVGDTGDGTYAIEGVEYRLRGTELSEVGVRTLQANVSEADFVYANLTCGGVSL